VLTESHFRLRTQVRDLYVLQRNPASGFHATLQYFAFSRVPSVRAVIRPICMLTMGFWSKSGNAGGIVSPTTEKKMQPQITLNVLDLQARP
jgi:hypothetical protein